MKSTSRSETKDSRVVFRSPAPPGQRKDPEGDILKEEIVSLVTMTNSENADDVAAMISFLGLIPAILQGATDTV